ncbi:MAG: NUDIX domain-containing protein [Oligoflexales bacterium]
MNPSVNLLIQNRDGKYLLQMRDGIEGICHPLKWNFFGGRCRSDESPIYAAKREIHEELNMNLPVDFFTLEGEIHTSDETVYVARLNKVVTWSDLLLGEGAGLGFFFVHEITKLDITPNTKKIVEKFLL